MWSYACLTAAGQIVSIEILSVWSRVSGGTVAVIRLAEDDNRPVGLDPDDPCPEATQSRRH